MTDVFLKILNMSITASWLLLAVFLVRLLLKKAPKWVSGVFWAMAALRLIIPFSLPSELSLIPSTETIPPDIALMPRPAISSGLELVNQAVNPLVADSFTPDPATSANPLQIVLPIAALIWLTGIAVLLLYALVSFLRLKKTVAASLPLDTSAGRVMACDDISSPFILGLFRPVIYVPSSMNGESLDYVLAHENAHLKRHDHWWKPLGYLLLTVYWFNPLVWIAYILFCKDIELACDEKVIRDYDKEQIAAYSETLLHCSAPHRRIAACPLAFGEVGTKERVKDVLRYKKPAFWIIGAALFIGLITSVLFLTDPFSARHLDERLAVSMDMAIANRAHTDHFLAIDYDVLKVSRSADQTTVYAWVFWEEYGFDGNDVFVESGSYIPSAITFDTSERGDVSSYPVIEYWTPRDGSYYADDIRAKFPWSIRRKALDISGSQAAKERCLELAKEYYRMHPEPTEDTHGSGGTEGTGQSGSSENFASEATLARTLSTVYTGISYAGYSEDPRIYEETLDPYAFVKSSVICLPVYRLDTYEDLQEFRRTFEDVFVFDSALDEMPSFDETMAAYDDAFFEEHTVILAYMVASSGAYRYAFRDVRIEEDMLILEIGQLNDPEVVTEDMQGWLFDAAVLDKEIEDITKIEAHFVGLLNP